MLQWTNTMETMHTHKKTARFHELLVCILCFVVKTFIFSILWIWFPLSAQIPHLFIVYVAHNFVWMMPTDFFFLVLFLGNLLLLFMFCFDSFWFGLHMHEIALTWLYACACAGARYANGAPIKLNLFKHVAAYAHCEAFRQKNRSKALKQKGREGKRERDRDTDRMNVVKWQA